MIPLSTKTEAARLVECYLDQSAQTHNQLKLSKPSVKRLIYVPCGKAVGGITLPKEFDRLAPAILRNTDLEKTLKI